MEINCRYDAFIGRWVIFHNGHLAIIKKVFNQNQRPILLLIMDTNEKPFVQDRIQTIHRILKKEKIPHQIITIPPIASINWGRKVGYETNYIEVDEDIQQISATNIKEKIQKNDPSWKELVPYD